MSDMQVVTAKMIDRYTLEISVTLVTVICEFSGRVLA